MLTFGCSYLSGLNLRASLIAQLVKNLPAMQETEVRFLGREDPSDRDRLSTLVFLGIHCGSAGKESACNAGDLGLIPRLGRSPGEGKVILPTPVFWPGEFHGLFSPWGPKELDMTERLSFISFVSVYLKCRYLSLTQNPYLWRYPRNLYFQQASLAIISTCIFQNCYFKDKMTCCEECYPVREV